MDEVTLALEMLRGLADEQIASGTRWHPWEIPQRVAFLD